MFTDICYAFGDFCLKCFKTIKSLHAKPNVMIIAVASVALIWWLLRMAKFNREAKENGTLP